MMRAAALCTLALFAFGSAGAQKNAALAGMVRDGEKHPIPDARVSVDGKELSAVTNDSGYFFLGGIPAGKSDFSVAKLGFQAVHFAVDLSPDTTLMVSIPMRTVQVLEGVDVKSTSTLPALLRDGYYDRLQKHLGSFVTPDKIQNMSYITSPSGYLRDVRGVQVRCRAAGRCTVLPNRTNGCLAVVVNHTYFRGQLDDAVSAGEVYAIEVYERNAIVPLEFSLPTAARNCGVIAVWTKSYVSQK